MTTETLKPFISAPCCADNTSAMRSSGAARCQRSSHLIGIILSTLAVALTLVLLGLMVWHFQRVSQLQNEVKHLEKVIISMQKRLGLTNLDDIGDYGKEYNHAFIDERIIVNDDDEDLIDEEDDDDINDEADEDEFDYEEFRKKLAMTYKDNMDDEEFDETADDIIDDADADEDVGNESEDEMDLSDEGDLYNDFSKFNATKKKKTSSRKPRSISLRNPSEEAEKNEKTKMDNRANNNEKFKDSHNQQKKMLMLRLPSQRNEASESRIEQKGSMKNQIARKRSQRRHMNSRSYKNSIVKGAKTLRLTQTATNTPAAHFHLNRKIPDHYASIKVDSYSGDMYIGHPSWVNEIDVDNYFRVENGILTVHEPGLYYVYAQVCYNNTHDQNGFVIFHGHKPFLQCLNTVPTNIPHKIHTCHTSGLIYLKENETIHLRDFHSDRNVILKDANNRSYFGLIKI